MLLPTDSHCKCVTTKTAMTGAQWGEQYRRSLPLLRLLKHFQNLEGGTLDVQHKEQRMETNSCGANSTSSSFDKVFVTIELLPLIYHARNRTMKRKWSCWQNSLNSPRNKARIRQWLDNEHKVHWKTEYTIRREDTWRTVTERLIKKSTRSNIEDELQLWMLLCLFTCFLLFVSAAGVRRGKF